MRWIGGARPRDNGQVEVYVLGLLRWARADGAPASLTRSEIEEIGGHIAATLDPEMHTEHDLEDTYYRVLMVPANDRRPERNCRAYEKLVPDSYRPFVREVQLGYYHNRLIVTYAVHPRMRGLHQMRVIRDELTKVVREQVFDPLAAKYTQPTGPGALQLIALRHTALQSIPQGSRLLDRELKKLRRGGYSEVYSVGTTTFGVYISGSRLAPLRPRHYVRLSMSGATVYVAGRTLPGELLIALVDAIYYGGLYVLAENDADVISETAWSDQQLLDVFALLRDSLRTGEGDDSALNAAQVGAIFAIASTVVGVIALVIA